MKDDTMTRPARRNGAAGNGEVGSGRWVGTSSESDPLAQRALRIWGAGDYDRISAGFRDGAEAFVARRGLKPHHEVLDAACGSGNLTIPAARSGAMVTGIDIVGALLTDASQWATREGLAVTLDAGNVEELPYDDARFDDRTWRLTTIPRTLTFRYHHTPAGTAELFRGSYGPTVRTFEALDEDGRASFAAVLREHWSRHNRGDSTSTEVESEYLEVVAVKL